MRYRAHVEETGRTVTEKPALFARSPRARSAILQPLVKPEVSDEFDYEGELAVVIGKAYKLYFFHINGGRHSFAMVGSGRRGLRHFMVKLCALDDVGQGYDLGAARGRPCRRPARRCWR